MVGYGPHTIVPNLVSPIFKLLTNYMDDLQVEKNGSKFPPKMSKRKDQVRLYVHFGKILDNSFFEKNVYNHLRIVLFYY